MIMKHISLIPSLLCGLLLLPGLSACHERMSVDDPSCPATSDDEYTILDEPIVLEFLVNAPRKVDPSVTASTRAVGDLDRTYTQADKDKATVNTPKRGKGEYNTGDEDYDDLLWRSYVYMADWIRTLSIPELRDTDYKVEGLIPFPDGISGTSIHFAGGLSDLAITTVPEKVTLTLYALPKSGTMTFIANGKRQVDYYNQDILRDLSLDNPYLLSSENDYYLGPWMKEDLKEDLTINSGSDVYSLGYLPMYARLYNVRRNDSGRGIKASETPTGEVVETRKIYLERAVAMVTVHWDRPTGDMRSFVEDAEFGYFPNVTSVIPNNWQGVLDKITEYNFPYVKAGTVKQHKRIPAYWHFLLNNRFTWKGVTPESMIDLREGYQLFFPPENFPTQQEWQSSIIAVMSKFERDPLKVTERRYKYFDLPYGEKNPETGLLEVHRNTWYNLRIKFRKAPDGTEQAYIASAWDDVDIPAEL